ncbi:MAG: metalloregulator ArsR/SmtB family transcription factor [Nitrospirota bacterium]
MKREKSIYELQAEVCKVLSSPKRIEIINALKEGEKTVTELVDILGTPKANVSQHLAVMRLKGILKSRRDGVNIYYKIANPKVIDACALMREVLSELLMERSKMASMVRKAE